MIETNGEKAYTTKETAAILQRTISTIRRYVKEGKLTGVMIGNTYHFTESELKEFAKKEGRNHAESY